MLLFNRAAKAKNTLKKEKVAVNKSNKSGSSISAKPTAFAKQVAKPAIITFTSTFTSTKSTILNVVFKNYIKSIKRSASINTKLRQKKKQCYPIAYIIILTQKKKIPRKTI
jgi:hypothetical protein